MAKSSWNHALVWVSLAGVLAGCSTAPDSQRSAGPLIKLPEAPVPGDELVPRAEPPSRTGNADTYVVFGRRYRVRETSEGYRERGIASWYGRDFHGRRTSSGPLFNMFDLTAAHKSLPLPTYVRVTNLDNGRDTVVKVTDRGPFVGRRLIDLSYAAAMRLGMEGRGTAPVEVVALEPYQFLPKLAASRAEQRELLASRALRAKPETGVAEIEFSRATPIQPSVQAPAQPQAPVLASLEQKPPPVQIPVRLARVDVEPAAPKAVAKAPVRSTRAKDEWNPSSAKAPVRWARVDGERNARPAKAPVRLALADGERAAPKTVTKAANGKPAKAEEERNSGRIGSRPSSVAPAAKGREAVVKPPVPAPNANRNGKPVSPRQASEPRPMAVRLASLKLNRSRGVAD
jgi:rare lipoprotein A (peptidoglycan hydrolase)